MKLICFTILFLVVLGLVSACKNPAPKRGASAIKQHAQQIEEELAAEEAEPEFEKEEIDELCDGVTDEEIREIRFSVFTSI